MKKLLLFLLCCIVSFAAVSCKPEEDPEKGGGSANVSVPTPPTEEALTVVCPENFSADMIYEIGYALDGYTVNFTNNASGISGRSLIIGNHESEIYDVAERFFNRISKTENYEARYLIYSNGESVALVYDEEVLGTSIAMEVAISEFIKGYTASGRFS